ncbi:hypothetical protein EWM64_g4905 [Hericium alpestre]|uniref:Carbohydrate-binding module family 19 domain-containing protein n=1 Tax=Hericium alpestre TaxID=135208 RepID=A0A4Y9ZW47_9AGAM|nr:hypothetical protein EWM64_g4905 [Hericium alpestre]
MYFAPSLVLSLSLFSAASAAVIPQRAVARQVSSSHSKRVDTAANADDAETLNNKFKTLTAGSACSGAESVCTSDGEFAQCANGVLVATPCAGGLTCAALPLVLSRGTSVTCARPEDVTERLAEARGGSAKRAGTPEAPAGCAAKGKRSSTSSGLTIAKRIAQADLPAFAQEWQDLCLASGGDTQTGQPCVQLAGIDGIDALLAAADPCKQQDVADKMIDFANSKGVTNRAALVDYAERYRKHPRNALALAGNIMPSSPFCQKAPKNAELKGLANAQLDGVNPGLFGGPQFPVIPFGAAGSCPLGQNANVNTCTCA